MFFSYLDCCYSTLAASNLGVGRNWMLGATTKENEATGVAWNSFTRTITRELERCANAYWTKGQKLSVQTLHSSLIRWERDLDFSPVLTRLTDHDCSPTDLTPLLISQPLPMVQSKTLKLSRTPLPQQCSHSTLFQPYTPSSSSSFLHTKPAPFTDEALHHSHPTKAPAIGSSSPHNTATINHSLPILLGNLLYDPYRLKTTNFLTKFVTFEYYMEQMLGEPLTIKDIQFVMRSSGDFATVRFDAPTIPTALMKIAYERTGRPEGDFGDIAAQYRLMKGYPPLIWYPMTRPDDPAPQFEAVEYDHKRYRATIEL